VGPSRVFGLAFSPTKDEMVVCGAKMIKFFAVQDRALKAQKVLFRHFLLTFLV
jgi:hypothetical protein